MDKAAVRVLLVDDDEDERVIVGDLLASAGTESFELSWVSTYEEGLQAMLAGACDVCLVDYRLGERSGLDLLVEVMAKQDHPQVVLMTGEGDRGVDVTAAKTGAADYLVKDGLTAALLERSIRYAAERGRSQKAVRDACESHSLNLAKNAFLANMGHEMRTPMNSILGMADMLWESPLSGEQMKYVEVLRRTGSGLLVLINDVLDLSQIESGRLELEHREFDLQEVVDQVIDFTAVKARAKGLVLLSDLSLGVPTSVGGDSMRLKQVLTNLIENAIKFTDSGEVALTVRNHESGKTGEIDFCISDTGIGIPPDKLETIFDNFAQADDSPTRRYGGSGLGLAISRHLVEAMGGALTISSCAGQGSIFRFTIAFAPVIEGSPTVGASAGDLAAETVIASRILVVDDSPDNRLLVQVYLKGKKYKVSFEEDAKSAVERFGAEDFDLILMDIQMPEMDGLAATRAIRAIERKRGSASIPILALTANGGLQDVEKSMDAGCNAHLSKPISKVELISAIETYRRQTQPANLTQKEFGERIRIEVPPGLAEIVPPYIARRKREVPEMIELLAKSDFAYLAILGHDLKGSGGGYGFLELTHLGAWVEQLAKQEDSGALRTRITELKNYLDRIQLV